MDVLGKMPDEGLWYEAPRLGGAARDHSGRDGNARGQEQLQERSGILLGLGPVRDFRNDLDLYRTCANHANKPCGEKPSAAQAERIASRCLAGTEKGRTVPRRVKPCWEYEPLPLRYLENLRHSRPAIR